VYASHFGRVKADARKGNLDAVVGRSEPPKSFGKQTLSYAAELIVAYESVGQLQFG